MQRKCFLLVPLQLTEATRSHLRSLCFHLPCFRSHPEAAIAQHSFALRGKKKKFSSATCLSGKLIKASKSWLLLPLIISYFLLPLLHSGLQLLLDQAEAGYRPGLRDHHKAAVKVNHFVLQALIIQYRIFSLLNVYCVNGLRKEAGVSLLHHDAGALT